MNMLVKSAAVAAAVPATLAPAVASVVAPSSVDDRAATVVRAKQIVELLSTRYIREGWKLDTERAAQFVESVGTFDENDGDCPKFKMVLDWMHDHGQSLDWLFTGDVDGFITGQAALRATAGAPTAIERLWKERKAALREYEAARKLCEKLEKVLEDRMPDPHPSIVWGGENESDGLKYWHDDKDPPYFKRYIFSNWLKTKLEMATRPKLAKVEVTQMMRGPFDQDRRRMILIEEREEGDPVPFTEEELALQKRLASRLELSRRYERKKARVSRQIGLTAAERRRDNACNRQCKLDRKILDARVVSPRDFVVKIAIYDFHQDGEGADEIVRDLKRSFKQPLSFVAAA